MVCSGRSPLAPRWAITITSFKRHPVHALQSTAGAHRARDREFSRYRSSIKLVELSARRGARVATIRRSATLQGVSMHTGKQISAAAALAALFAVAPAVVDLA